MDPQLQIDNGGGRAARAARARGVNNDAGLLANGVVQRI